MVITDVQMIGETIKKRRKELNLTQQYLAEVTGLSTSFISDVENGKQTAEVGKIIKLINMLGMNIIVESR